MTRLINIYINDNHKHIDGFTELDIRALDTVVNCSVDHIYTNVLEQITPEQLSIILPKIMSKIRPGGLLTTEITNMKYVTRLYSMNSIDDKDFLEYIKDKQMIISPEILSLTIEQNNTFKVVQTVYADDQTSITISAQRNSL